MDRYWPTYGTWLPGDSRGFVSAVDDGNGGTVIHNISGTPYDADWHHLREYAKTRLDGGPVLLDSQQLLRDFKSYASRALNQAFGLKAKRRTESGSRRKLKTDEAILSATAYVRDQKSPLVLWIDEKFIAEIGERRNR